MPNAVAFPVRRVATSPTCWERERERGVHGKCWGWNVLGWNEGMTDLALTRMSMLPAWDTAKIGLTCVHEMFTPRNLRCPARSRGWVDTWKIVEWNTQCGCHNGRTIINVGRVGGHQDMLIMRLLPFCVKATAFLNFVFPPTQLQCQVLACLITAAVSLVQECTAPITHLAYNKKEGWKGGSSMVRWLWESELTDCSLENGQTAAYDAGWWHVAWSGVERCREVASGGWLRWMVGVNGSSGFDGPDGFDGWLVSMVAMVLIVSLTSLTSMEAQEDIDVKALLRSWDAAMIGVTERVGVHEIATLRETARSRSLRWVDKNLS